MGLEGFFQVLADHFPVMAWDEEVCGVGILLLAVPVFPQQVAVATGILAAMF